MTDQTKIIMRVIHLALGMFILRQICGMETVEETGIEEPLADDAPTPSVSLKGLRPENPNFYFGKFRFSTKVDYSTKMDATSMTGKEGASLSFIRLSKVGKMVIQTINDEGHMIKHFKLQSSIDGHNWVDLNGGRSLSGNTESMQTQQICFIHKFYAKKLKFVPVDFYTSPSFKVDIYMDMKDNVNLEGSRPEFSSQLKNPQTGKMSGFCDQLVWTSIYEKYGGSIFPSTITDTFLDDYVMIDEDIKARFAKNRKAEELRSVLIEYLTDISGGPRATKELDLFECIKDCPDCLSKLKTFMQIALKFNNVESEDIHELSALFGQTTGNKLAFPKTK